jgi:hypothetical protein
VYNVSSISGRRCLYGSFNLAFTAAAYFSPLIMRERITQEEGVNSKNFVNNLIYKNTCS